MSDIVGLAEILKIKTAAHIVSVFKNFLLLVLLYDIQYKSMSCKKFCPFFNKKKPMVLFSFLFFCFSFYFLLFSSCSMLFLRGVAGRPGVEYKAFEAFIAHSFSFESIAACFGSLIYLESECVP